MSNIKTFDREVMKRVQAVEHDIPPDLERTFLEEFKTIIPEKERRRGRRRPVVYYGGLAAAAAVLLAAFLFVFYFIHRSPDTFTAEAEEVWVQSALVEGEPANTVVVNTTNPDITIVWVEKVKK
ncbi:MAG: hypothetical protein GTO45_26115 [Candidatus Aminicenantes bacterium]|nr:hypothetical protein [Candidatus Aminicenantes bacterium]NIM82214.1 hypothetical protein [Candidatus Aminicenantes bacterium]NIN21616.1 hypothetical protein [Candidatus Aminicenantes bacterium]NIN45425.1 hypothetical protein [Candidatus Aminicenantes bacterium]NIN88246.1 hypothetical protein [Candidatus Aminicenantes bacterium]